MTRLHPLILLMMIVAPGCAHPRGASAPTSRDHALLQFVNMPEDGTVECIGGCEGLDLRWTARDTLHLTPIVEPTSLILHYRAQGVDEQIRMKIVPTDLKIRFPGPE